MLIIKEVYEKEDIKDFLIKRWLIKQYLKSVSFLKKWFFWKSDFKQR